MTDHSNETQIRTLVENWARAVREGNMDGSLTIGFRKVHGKWLIAHEHHSAPHKE